MKLKRNLLQFCLLGGVCLSAANTQAQFTCTTNNGTITITRYTGTGGAVTIPGTITGLPVTGIGDEAFDDISTLTSVTILSGVTTIGELAFGNCTNLTSITVDPSNPAFSSSNGILFDKNQTELIQYPEALAGPYTIPSSVTGLGMFAFIDCPNLTQVTLLNGVNQIGYGVFSDCINLSRITVGSGVTNIGDFAFFQCPNLNGVYFAGDAPTLGGTNAFDANSRAIVYYFGGTAGWGATYGGVPTSLYQPANIVTNVVAGLYHSLFIKSDGSLWGMGENGSGQLGIGTINNTNRPEPIATNVIAMAGGGFHTLFIKGDGSLWAMGDNQYGELGDGTTTNSILPKEIVPNGVVAVAAGVYHSLFLKSDSSLWGMGYNHEGELGDGTSGSANQTNLPEYLDTNVTAIAAGNYHSLYLKGGSVWFMGKNDAGQLGNGTYNNIYTHSVVVRSATAIAARANHTFYLSGENLYATGDNSSGQFGDGTFTSINIPKGIETNVTTVAAGSDHTLFVQNGGSMWGMGLNTAGQLGDGTFNTTNRAETIVPAGVTAVAGGDQHSLFIEGDGSLWGMGNNGGGEMGDGTYNNTNRPEQIIGPIVANGGFEMGNFDGWMTNANPASQVLGTAALSGSYAAEFSETIFMGDEGTLDLLSQTLPTRTGASYVLSFWVNGIQQSSCGVSWNGINLLTNSIFYPGFSALNPGWTNFQFVVTATSTNTPLQFSFRASPGANNSTSLTAIDDVSVSLLPSKIVVQVLGATDVRLSFVGNANADYVLDRTFNLTPPIQWVPQATNLTDANGMLVLTNTPVATTNNFWRIRSAP